MSGAVAQAFNPRLGKQRLAWYKWRVLGQPGKLRDTVKEKKSKQATETKEQLW